MPVPSISCCGSGFAPSYRRVSVTWSVVPEPAVTVMRPPRLLTATARNHDKVPGNRPIPSAGPERRELSDLRDDGMPGIGHQRLQPAQPAPHPLVHPAILPHPAAVPAG